MDDIPDDQSLQDLINEERKQHANYYDVALLPSSKNPGNDKTRFIAAPKNYDPIKTGFIKQKKTMFYEFDENDFDRENVNAIMKNTNNPSKSSSYRSMNKNRNIKDAMLEEQDSFEPSVEVVIDERTSKSTMWKL